MQGKGSKGKGKGNRRSKSKQQEGNKKDSAKAVAPTNHLKKGFSFEF